ncbi:5'-methylthioadenosine/S-adenosylhomocysteine nucleosidase [Halioxenophilus sp. WMMB6]|uniref:5'-methylthioadenosine/S-adenosylhomocysteine nucleosidase n=1 Tax=Halioxenophilus sp. WMMB6 TaxID=3073815 RepID=UPI00295F3E6C|nr:5'-methylthioadenosine/S-adenosylhomocysteine nucleosidase [Halioxenophilus sp. WMMB6]
MKSLARWFLLTVVIITTTGCQTTPEQAADPTGYTAVMVAYAPELEGILSTLESLPHAGIDRIETIKGVTYRIGHFHDQPILIFATGMSIANAAMTTQMALDYFPINEVVYMGIAGAVNPQWQPGDVIVPERWYYHDESVYSNPDPAEPGSYLIPDYYRRFLAEQPARRAADPNVPNYQPIGFIHPDEVVVIKDGLDKPQDTPYFSASPRLLKAAQQAIASMPTQRVLDERDAVLSVGGNGVTGSVFLDNREYRKWVRDVFNAEVTEMESAAVGQVCYANEVDWMIIRAISDLAGGQEGVNVEHIYDSEVSRIGAEVLFAVLEELSHD